MNLTLSVVIMLVAYTIGAITKLFTSNLPSKFIPIQNVVVGVISGIICFFLNIETNILESILVSIMSTMSAGGIADLISIGKSKTSEESKG